MNYLSPALIVIKTERLAKNSLDLSLVDAYTISTV
jgi:hypothetical protein